MAAPLSVNRRQLIWTSTVAAAATAMAGALPAAALAQTSKIEAEEHWVMKGSVKLYVCREHAIADRMAAA
jgi:hypothetical protein